jgi:hypothetical protein
VEQEELLAGGIANAGAVARVGRHVLRPSNPHTAAIHRFLSYLASAGFDGAPVPVGIEPDGRERLEFIDGQVALPPYPEWAQSDRSLISVAQLIRRFHVASRGFDLTGCSWSSEMADPSGGGVLCHNDVCLENVVFRDGIATALLDFDFAAPGRPVYDLAQFARMCVPIDDDVNAAKLGWAPADRPARLRLVADAFGLDPAERRQLIEVLDASMAAGGAFVRRRVEAGDPNFTAMWDAMGGAERFDRRRLWWVEHSVRFVDALA